jgi:hypothetical protein
MNVSMIQTVAVTAEALPPPMKRVVCRTGVGVCRTGRGSN